MFGWGHGMNGLSFAVFVQEGNEVDFSHASDAMVVPKESPDVLLDIVRLLEIIKANDQLSEGQSLRGLLESSVCLRKSDYVGCKATFHYLLR